MEVKKFNNFITEGKEEEKDGEKKGKKCTDCGKKMKKCKCPVTEKMVSQLISEKKMNKAQFLEMIGKGKKGKGKKGKKEEKEEKGKK